MKKLLLSLCLLFTASMSNAHEEHTMPQKSNMAISVAMDATGKLWRTKVHDGIVMVDYSSDFAKSFSSAVKVNPTPQKIAADGEARPKIAIGPESNLYLTWTEALKKPFTGYIWFARSVDGGKSFEKPYIVHTDRAEITHRFDALNVAPDGQLTVSWVDKRDLIAAKAAGKKYDGAAIYYAVSTDKGASFKPEQKLADSSCECCRIVTTNKPDGTVVALWRHVFEGSERDHMIAEIPSKEAPKTTALEANNHAVSDAVIRRATFGHWVIDGCPHHGAALASGGEGANWWGYHMAYFDGNDKKPGLYYSRMDGVAWASSPPKKFGDNSKQAGHPALLAIGQQVWLVWREIKDGKSSIWGAYSEDEGKTWRDAKLLISATEKTDYPILVQYKNAPYLVWNTQQSGLQMRLLAP
jgi:hypothetical protein